MRRKMMFLFTILMLVSLMIAPVSIAKAQVDTQASTPDCPNHFDPALMHDPGFLQSLPPECAKTYKKLVQNSGSQIAKPNSTPLAVGGPDTFGYTYDDTLTYSWIDASTGTNSGLTGDDVASSSPTPIGFNFPFYGLTQSQLYFNTNGLITFGAENVALLGGVTIPSINAPNNYIAPLWDDLLVGSPYNSGAIYYLLGGISPNRYFVIEWKDVTTFDGSSAFSFEAILYQNGDIVVQHQSLPASYDSTVGIENSLGSEGLQYQSGTSGLSTPPKAIRFSYPIAATARVLVSPLKAGKFSAIGGTTDFTMKVYNTGNSGPDTFDITTASTWPVTLYAADGTTLLTDTNANGRVDTGTILQGGSSTVIARFSTPGGAAIGDSNAAIITANSALDISKTKSTSLSMAVPTSFTNVFQDTTDGAMSFMIAAATIGAPTYKATLDNYVGYDVAVAKLESGNYLYTWDVGVPVGSIWMHDIEYALLGHNGSIILPVTKLTNNFGASILTQDTAPSVAVAPNGTIGMVWFRRYQNSLSQWNYNIYSATLNSAGSLLSGPTNVTNNTIWGARTDPNIPNFINPTIAASDDNRFILSWEDDLYDGISSWHTNIWYAVRNTAGANVIAPAELTNDNISSWPIINNLTGGKAILTWNSNNVPTYAVLNSGGAIFKTAASLGVSNVQNTPDAVLLPNGKVAVAWATSTGVQFDILNSSYILESGPATANNLSLTPGYALSVTTDPSSHVIITWNEGTTYLNTFQNLFYALGDSTGTFITAPMSYKQSYAGSFTSFNGEGNAPFLPPGADAAANFDASIFNGPPSGHAAVGIHYTNYGSTTATGVTLTITLDSHLTYVSDTSGVTPTVIGNNVTWNLPDVVPLGGQDFTLDVAISSGATLGTHYPISLSLTSNSDINSSNNTGNAQVMAALQVFLPLIMR